jgi:hypothetical protein
MTKLPRRAALLEEPRAGHRIEFKGLSDQANGGPSVGQALKKKASLQSPTVLGVGSTATTPT